MTVEVTIHVKKTDKKPVFARRADPHTLRPEPHVFRVDPGSSLTLAVWHESGLVITEHNPDEIPK